MLNEEKIREMNELALYESGVGKEHLLISRYYRTDYVGQALIRTFFLVTIGYVLILAVVGVYNYEYFMENIHKMDLRMLFMTIVVGYVILMVFYLVLTLLVYNVKYYRAKKYVKQYYSKLTQLDKIYQREDRKGGRKR